MGNNKVKSEKWRGPKAIVMLDDYSTWGVVEGATVTLFDGTDHAISVEATDEFESTNEINGVVDEVRANPDKGRVLDVSALVNLYNVLLDAPGHLSRDIVEAMAEVRINCIDPK